MLLGEQRAGEGCVASFQVQTRDEAKAKLVGERERAEGKRGE